MGCNARSAAADASAACLFQVAIAGNGNSGFALEEGLVSSQEASVTLGNGDLDSRKPRAHAGNTTGMVTVSMRQRDSAELLANLFGDERDIVRGRGRRAVDQREAVVILDQVAVHREHCRVPGELNQVGAVTRYLQVALLVPGSLSARTRSRCTSPSKTDRSSPLFAQRGVGRGVVDGTG